MHYGPVFTATKADGTPLYAPNIAEIDDEISNNQRAETTNEETRSTIADQNQAINDLR